MTDNRVSVHTQTRTQTRAYMFRWNEWSVWTDDCLTFMLYYSICYVLFYVIIVLTFIVG